MSIFNTKTTHKTHIQINCTNLHKNTKNEYFFDDLHIRVYHNLHEQIGINRILIEEADCNFEILPSKGFSVGKAMLKNKPLFWDVPVNLIHPDLLNLSEDEIFVKGEKRKGFSGIQNMAGGVEMYGVFNWGAPDIDPNTGAVLPLHGTLSNLPAEHAQIAITDTNVVASCILEVRDGIGESYKTWYDRGETIFLVHKTIIFNRHEKTLHISDMIENVSEKKQIPEWGYQVNFKPEKGSKLFIPATVIEKRGGGKIHKMFDTWAPSPYPNHRIENSIIFKNMKVSPYLFNDQDGITALVEHPDHTGIIFHHTPAPYYESWFSAGGKHTKEFTYLNEIPILQYNWDAIGIKLGSGPYDRDGNICPDIEYNPVLDPGKTITTNLVFEVSNQELTEKIERSINNYNKGRIWME